jgi:3',5'-cyclic AMP phosphodiesterase CpdA
MRGQDGQRGVTILHVSDTQFGQHHRFDDANSLSSHLIRDLKNLSGIGVPTIDLVVLSGDIAEQGKRSEYDQARGFVDALCQSLGLDRRLVVVVPGNHDVSWAACKSYFANCDDEETTPRLPYPRKWRHYQDFACGLHGQVAFTEEQPYQLHRFDELGVAVAAINSTMRESHLPDDHYGHCGDDQLRWFAEQLDECRDLVRIGVVHHNVRRRAEADNENLRDEDRLTDILHGHLDLVLHGHTHEGKEDRLSDGTLVLATGSAAVTADWRPDEVPNQYQVLRLTPDSVQRWARQWADHRWIADPRVSRDGNRVMVRIRWTAPAWRSRRSRDGSTGRQRRAEWDPWDADGPRRTATVYDFISEVESVTRADLGGDVAIVRKVMYEPRLDYLLASKPKAPARCVGVVHGALTTETLDAFDDKVFGPLRPRGAIDLMIVHHGPDDPALRAAAKNRGVFVKTWTEYNDLLDPSAYRTWLLGELDRDTLYPQKLYLPQRFRSINRYGGASTTVGNDLLDVVYDAMIGEEGRFALVLGEAGFGKSFLVRRLAHRMLSNDRVAVSPIVVYLRERDKRETLDSMISAALIPSGASFQSDRFQHSLRAGSLALLVDGYDEFAVRVGYANAAAQLRTFLDAMQGRARILLTTRPGHFRSTDEVTSKLFDSVREIQQAHVYQLEPFDEAQQHAFLARWFTLRGHDNPDGIASQWMGTLATVDNLPELARTPRMLSFIVEDLALDEIRQAAAGNAVLTAAALYQRLVSHWLANESLDPDGKGAIAPTRRQRVIEELALALWRSGERDATENALHTAVRQVLDLPRLELTLDQAAQEIGGRALLQVDSARWKFAHQSVWEFLLANRLAALLRDHDADEVLGEAELTSLTVRFLRDLAPTETVAWLRRMGGGDE